jgi:hypothetical protein
MFRSGTGFSVLGTAFRDNTTILHHASSVFRILLLVNCLPVLCNYAKLVTAHAVIV